MPQPLAAKTIGQMLIDHPDNLSVLAEASKGKCGPAVGYLLPGLNPLYPVTVVFYTARYEPTRWFYHVDTAGKLWLPAQQPKVLMAIPDTPDLSADGGWHTV